MPADALAQLDRLIAAGEKPHGLLPQMASIAAAVRDGDGADRVGRSPAAAVAAAQCALAGRRAAIQAERCRAAASADRPHARQATHTLAASRPTWRSRATTRPTTAARIELERLIVRLSAGSKRARIRASIRSPCSPLLARPLLEIASVGRFFYHPPHFCQQPWLLHLSVNVKRMSLMRTKLVFAMIGCALGRTIGGCSAPLGGSSHPPTAVAHEPPRIPRYRLKNRARDRPSATATRSPTLPACWTSCSRSERSIRRRSKSCLRNCGGRRRNRGRLVAEQFRAFAGVSRAAGREDGRQRREGAASRERVLLMRALASTAVDPPPACADSKWRPAQPSLAATVDRPSARSASLSIRATPMPTAYRAKRWQRRRRIRTPVPITPPMRTSKTLAPIHHRWDCHPYPKHASSHRRLSRRSSEVAGRAFCPANSRFSAR